MRDADFPDRFWFSGRFKDDTLEQEYWLNVRPVAFRLAALAAFLAGITWLTSVTHELQIQDMQQGVRLLIAWRVSFFMYCLIVVGALLSEATRAPKSWVRWLLVGWYAFLCVARRRGKPVLPELRDDAGRAFSALSRHLLLDGDELRVDRDVELSPVPGQRGVLGNLYRLVPCAVAVLPAR
ncbi:hypothetical protein [Maricaulis sp. MIT060901]|uniref:hypothetical protein n=1 Tax=Maricaulis sp. MIT060901 TaxID=3096993 RepID=UPI00399960D4